ncbi:MAG TPA: tRNA pseudouridine(55) synthase TruB, partial [Tissierellaceae bacterium]
TKIMFRVVCSKGTYIRTLCNDIGEKLKTYGYMSYLIRTQVGNFSLDKSYSREYLESLTMEEFEEILLPMDIAITNMKSFTLKDSLYDKIVNGLKIKVENDNLDINTDYKIYCKNEFIGIGEFRKIDNDFYLKMKKVLV